MHSTLHNLKHLLFLLPGFLGFTVNQAYSQCTITAGAYPMEVCAGQTVNLVSSGHCGYLMKNDFNNSTPGPGWNATPSAMFTNPCGPPVVNGLIYLWMGPTTPHPRILETVDFNLVMGGQVSFDLRYAIQAQASPCEGPDEMEEGVSLQYSTNSGGTWHDIIYFCPDGTFLATNPLGNSTSVANGPTPFTSWANYSFPIPAGAQTTHTRLRWAQLGSSGNDYDHWGLDNVELVVPTPDAKVLWSTGDTTYNASANPAQSGWYRVTISDSFSYAKDSVYVTVHPNPSADFSFDSPICSEFYSTEVLFTGTQAGGSTFHWYFGGLTPDYGSGPGPYYFDSIPAGNYPLSLELTSQYGCQSDLRFDTLVVNQSPLVSLSADQFQGCDSLTVQFHNNVYPPGGTFLWDFGDGQTGSGSDPVHTYHAGSDSIFAVKLSATSAGGCTQSYTANGLIKVYPSPVAAFTADPDSTILENATITFTNNSEGGVTFWNWDFADGSTSTEQNPVYTYPVEGIYYVSLIDISDHGCSDTVKHRVRIIKLENVSDSLDFPNVFTPNGDGRNDRFTVAHLIDNLRYYPVRELTVFNRWGRVVYEKKDYVDEWDGKNLDDGVYYYLFKYTFYVFGRPEKHKEITGSVTILR